MLGKNFFSAHRQQSAQELPIEPIANLEKQLVAVQNAQARIERRLDEIASVTGPFGVPVGNDRVLVQTRFGIKYFVEATDLVMTPQLIIYREWEGDLSRLLLSSVKSDTVFVDVGANFGYFTCLVGSAIGAGKPGRVLAFEPNPAMFALLTDNIEVNWSMCPIEPFPYALSNAKGTASFILPDRRAANARLASAQDPHAITIETMRLDDVVPDLLAVDILKIDVEGYEIGVLQGAMRTIARSPHISIIMEWSLGQMSDAGCSPDQLIALMRDLQLSSYALPATLNASLEGYTRLDDDALKHLQYGNILLARAR